MTLKWQPDNGACYIIPKRKPSFHRQNYSFRTLDPESGMTIHSDVVIEKIIVQHAEEAAFLWLLREGVVYAPHYLLNDIAKLDGRIQAGARFSWGMAGIATKMRYAFGTPRRLSENYGWSKFDLSECPRINDR